MNKRVVVWNPSDAGPSVWGSWSGHRAELSALAYVSGICSSGEMVAAVFNGGCSIVVIGLSRASGGRMNIPLPALMQFRRALACATDDRSADWGTRLRAASALGSIDGLVRMAVQEQQTAKDQHDAWLDRQAA